MLNASISVNRMLRTRNGELNKADLREVQLSVLADFDRLCRAHGLVYYLAFGTLLGAVRHGGYIPWDDDIDVMMPRADYDRLTEVFPASAPSHLSLGNSDTRADWPFPWAKVGDDRTELIEPLQDPLALGVNLDVFPLDALPSNRLIGAVHSAALELLRWAGELHYIAPERGRGWHSALAISVAKPLIRLLPASTLMAAMTRVVRSGRLPADRVGVRVGSFDWSVEASALGTPSELPFEHLMLPAPANPDAVLTEVYGDYRDLPPEAERVSHHAFSAHWRAQD